MDVRALQFEKLRRLIEIIEDSGKNPLAGSGEGGAVSKGGELGVGVSFCQRLLKGCGVTASGLESLEEFVSKVPFTTKDDLVGDHAAHPPFGSNLTFPISDYTRFCQTSGTSSGVPMAWVDTPESWEAMLECWRGVYRAAGVKAGIDRIFFAFSFGPFLGFWTAFEAAGENLVIPGGGLSSTARLSVMARYGATVLCCTPTYAIRLGEVLRCGESPVGPEEIRVKKIIVAGEPGGSLPATRARISELWEADVFDHHGMTEVGPVSYEHPMRRGNLAVIESAYFAEILDRATGKDVGEGQEGELVLTTLDRVACPLLRYRTGDLVRRRTVDGVLCLEGGVLGRCDDMVVVRGVNLYPSAIEGVVREVAEVVEFQVVERESDAMREIGLEVEISAGDGGDVRGNLENALRDRFSMRIPVRVVESGSLPRYEFKAKRWVKR